MLDKKKKFSKKKRETEFLELLNSIVKNILSKREPIFNPLKIARTYSTNHYYQLISHISSVKVFIKTKENKCHLLFSLFTSMIVNQQKTLYINIRQNRT